MNRTILGSDGTSAALTWTSRITESYRHGAPRVKGRETLREGSGQRAREGTEAQGLKGEQGESGDQTGVLC